MYKENLALYSLLGLICNKTQPTPTNDFKTIRCNIYRCLSPDSI